MNHQINGLKDIYKLLMNERKVGGVIEASTLRLWTGEVYQNAVITQIDLLGSSIYSIGFTTKTLNVSGVLLQVNAGRT